MRVGVFGQLLSGAQGYRQAGVSRYIQQLLAAMPPAAPDDEFVVFAGRGARGALDGLPSRLHWRLTRWPTERPELRILWEQVVGPLVLRRERIDVAHAPVNVAPLLTRVPTVVTVHDLAFLVYPEQYPGAKQRYLNTLTRVSTRRAARVIAVSEHTRRDLLRFYDLDPARVVTVSNGVDPACRPVDDQAALEGLRRRYRLPSEFILFVGTLQPRKNLIGLLRAYAQLLETVAIPLVVVGAKGWMYQAVFEEARTLGVADRVVFAGYASAAELPLWYSAATVFVYPSLYEGFGLPVLEAMACGAPVITSSTSSLPEVAGDAALLVNPLDASELADALARLLSDPALRMQLRQRGFAQAAAFTWEQTAQQTVAVFRDAVGTVSANPTRVWSN